MGKIFMIIMGLTLLVIWLGFLVPQYAAWKNKRYKAIKICLCAFIVSLAAFVALIIYGDFVPTLLYGKENSHTAQANEFVLCVLTFIWVVGHYFCWWYIYGRKSLDFIHISGYTADELEQLISPQIKELIGLK